MSKDASQKLLKYLEEKYGKDGILIQSDDDGRLTAESELIDLWEVLPKAFGYSKSHAKRLLAQGAIRIWEPADTSSVMVVCSRWLLLELPCGIASGKRNFMQLVKPAS